MTISAEPHAVGADARNAKILSLYRDGKMMKDIARAVGLAPNSIVGILRKLGVERPSKPQKRWRGRDDIAPKVKELWELGLCASQIKERLSCERRLVDEALTRLQLRTGQPPRHRYDGAAVGGSGRSGHNDRAVGISHRLASVRAFAKHIASRDKAWRLARR